MTKIKAIIQDFKTAPVAVKSANVKPAAVKHVQNRSQIKKAMRSGSTPPANPV